MVNRTDLTNNKLKKNMKYFFALFILFPIISCQDDNSVDFDKQNDEDIINYIEKNNLNAKKSNSGLYYVIQEAGSGDQPNVNSDVTVNYKGYYLNGSVFDQSNSSGITFNLQQVIQGWTEGITYFKEGGKGILLIPSRLGYGYQDTRGIPGGSVLIFDIELIDVK